MSTTSQPAYSVTTSWTDLCATVGSASGVSVLIQNLTEYDVEVVASGGVEPDQSVRGIILDLKDSIELTASNIWVRSSHKPSQLAVMTL